LGASDREIELNYDHVNDVERTRSIIERWIGAATVVVLALACLLILRPFISAALWAAILCFATWPLFISLRIRLGGRQTVAASLATLALSVLIIAPIVFLASRLSGNIAEIISATRKFIHEGPTAAPAWVVSLPLVGGRLGAYWNLLSKSSATRFSEIVKWLPIVQKAVLGSGRALAAGVFQVVLSLLMVFLFYRNGEGAAQRLIFTINRVGGGQGIRLLNIAVMTMRAVVYGVLGTALLQGMLAGAGFMIAGVLGAALLGFLTFVVAVIPGGPLLVAAPAIFWLYHQESTEWAIFIVVWMVIVGNLDNVVRPFLIAQGGGSTPLILVILGVLGGAMAFGLIGLFLGPTLLAVGYSIFDEWSSHSQELISDNEQKAS
jgi:predicted PurR-regulated permease PerM